MLLRDIVKKLGLEILSSENNLDSEVTYAYSSDILSDVMACASKGCLWITNQSHQNVIAIVYFRSLAGVIIAGNQMPDDETLKKAKEKNISVLKTEHSAYDVAGKLYEIGIRGIV